MDAARQQILDRFREGESALDVALAGLDPESATLKPAPDRWSIVEIVEHLAASEEFLLGRLHQSAPSATSHADPAREARLESLALNRERRIDAPAPVLPTGACATLAQALRRFRAVRAQTIQFVENFSGDLRSSLVEHPLIARPLNCYEMLLLMALHPIRHAAQITELRPSPSPASET
jgi:uncharacterized damage-inducible protein DinB